MEAITGRRFFYYYEMRRLVMAENIVTGYKSRAASENWAQWVKDNPVLSSMLAEAEILATGNE